MLFNIDSGCSLTWLNLNFEPSLIAGFESDLFTNYRSIIDDSVFKIYEGCSLVLLSIYDSSLLELV